jgi:hypothetical protein
MQRVFGIPASAAPKLDATIKSMATLVFTMMLWAPVLN